MQVFVPLSNILVPAPEALLAVGSVSEPCFETYVNIFGRDALLEEKPNDDSLVVFHPWTENRKTRDLARIIVNVLPI
jgi:hypothetical protein